MNKTDKIFIVYKAAGASDFHVHFVAAIKAGGKLPEELADLFVLTKIENDARASVLGNGVSRWRVDSPSEGFPILP